MKYFDEIKLDSDSDNIFQMLSKGLDKTGEEYATLEEQYNRVVVALDKVIDNDKTSLNDYLEAVIPVLNEINNPIISIITLTKIGGMYYGEYIADTKMKSMLQGLMMSSLMGDTEQMTGSDK